MVRHLAWSLLCLVVGCSAGPDNSTADAGPDASKGDVVATVDAGTTTDAGSSVADAGATVDAGASTDAGTATCTGSCAALGGGDCACYDNRDCAGGYRCKNTEGQLRGTCECGPRGKKQYDEACASELECEIGNCTDGHCTKDCTSDQECDGTVLTHCVTFNGTCAKP